MKKKILLVEDNPATVDIVQTELEFLGYDSIVAENGNKAVDMAASQMPDLIMMDISLPKMDGLEATSLIRNNPKTKSTPIIAATARALPGDREKCLERGCDDCRVKPYGLGIPGKKPALRSPHASGKSFNHRSRLFSNPVQFGVGPRGSG